MLVVDVVVKQRIPKLIDLLICELNVNLTIY
jgi:hypothetical protein